MGAIFKPPRAPAPPPPPPPPPPAAVVKAPPTVQVETGTGTVSVPQTEARRTIRANAAKKGQSAAVKTRTVPTAGRGAKGRGGLGLLDPAPVRKKTLLGQ